jgi:hypothetical protein
MEVELIARRLLILVPLLVKLVVADGNRKK